MTPRGAGIRLIVFSVPFLAFGLVWALRPPLEHRLPQAVTAMGQVLGVATALMAVGGLAFGLFLVARRDERVL